MIEAHDLVKRYGSTMAVNDRHRRARRRPGGVISAATAHGYAKSSVSAS